MVIIYGPYQKRAVKRLIKLLNLVFKTFSQQYLKYFMVVQYMSVREPITGRIAAAGSY